MQALGVSMLTTIRKFWSDWFGRHKEEEKLNISPLKRPCSLEDDLMLHGNFPKRRRFMSSDVLSSRYSSDDFLCPARNFGDSNRMQSGSLFCTDAMSPTSVHINPDGRGNEAIQEMKENVISISDDEEDAEGELQKRETSKKSDSVLKEQTDWGALKRFTKQEQYFSRNKPPSKNTETDSDVQFLKMVGQKSEGSAGIPYRRLAVKERSRNFVMPFKANFQFRSKSSSQIPVTTERMTSPRKLSVNESFRLDEKRKYSELLQKFTRVPVSDSTPPLTGIRPSGEKRRFGHLDSSKSPRVVPVIDLTKIKDGSSGDSASRNLSVPKMKVESKTDHSNDVIKKTKENPLYDPQWTADLTLMYDHKTLDRRRKEEQEKLKIQLRSQRSKEIIQEFLEEQLQTHLRITEVAIPEEITLDDDETELPKLTPAMEKLVNSAFQRANPGDVLVECFGQRLLRRDLLTLSANNWLNDEVINFYMNLLIERGKQDKYPSMYGFNTFFYPKLLQGGQSSLKRWTRKIDIFAHDILIVPVHLGVHWCMAAIDLRKKTIKYYDSMGAANVNCLQALFRYLEDEMWDKKKQRFDRTGWTTENVKNIPQQMNGSDCGMFACMYAEFLCRGARITFSQTDMPYFRRKMAYEILSKKLLL